MRKSRSQKMIWFKWIDLRGRGVERRVEDVGSLMSFGCPRLHQGVQPTLAPGWCLEAKMPSIWRAGF